MFCQFREQEIVLRTFIFYFSEENCLDQSERHLNEIFLLDDISEITNDLENNHEEKKNDDLYSSQLYTLFSTDIQPKHTPLVHDIEENDESFQCL